MSRVGWSESLGEQQLTAMVLLLRLLVVVLVVLLAMVLLVIGGWGQAETTASLEILKTGIVLRGR